MFDYNSAKDLADHLKYLDSNRTAYNEYFKWKKYVKFDKPVLNPLCDLCIQLQLDSYFGVKKSIIKDVNSYWNKKDCRIPVFS